MKRLVMSDGLQEREWLLVSNLVVGRDPMCDISEADSLLSRRHAEFVVGPDGVLVRDLGSRNGIFINGIRVAESRIKPGDAVQIGNLKMQYVDDATPLAAAPQIVDADRTLLVAAPAQEPPPAPPQAKGDEGAGEAGIDESEATRLILTPASKPPTPKPAAPAEPEEDASEATRLVPPPSRGTPRPAAAPTPAPAPFPRAARTIAIPPPPRAAVKAPELPKIAPAVQPAVRDRAPLVATPPPAIAGFVYGLVGLSTVVTIGLTAAPFMRAQVDMIEVTVSIVVAFSAAMLAATLISHRARSAK